MGTLRGAGRFARGESSFGWVNRVSGSMMIAFGAMLALAQRPSM
ncbi:hypothetical protein [Ciceribacter thiooxidans]|uniref:LysE type translocator n=1 Tax=Ciceribacter thiooxidans TaxID=1969821 RepID=A0ABV7I3U4_9HYPH|nr:hypothetical protein [Ciceribacter thiooxidans]